MFCKVQFFTFKYKRNYSVGVIIAHATRFHNKLLQYPFHFNAEIWEFYKQGRKMQNM